MVVSDALQQGGDVFHGGPVVGAVAGAEEGDAQRLEHLLYLRVGPALQLGVEDLDWVSLALEMLSRPLHNVLPLGEGRVDRPLSGDELQQHNSEAVYVAFLCYLQHAGILCNPRHHEGHSYRILINLFNNDFIYKIKINVYSITSCLK